MFHRTCSLSLASVAITSCLVSTAHAQTVKAAYFYQNTFASTIAGAPNIVPVDPLTQNSFQTTTVFGQTRSIYNRAGNAAPNDQEAGLSLDTTGLVNSSNYSIETVFDFSERDNAWRRIVDVQNRTSDTGLYIDPSNHLNTFNVGGGSTPWTNDTFHHVILTTNANTVKGYLDGVSEFTLTTDVMNINNPNNLLNLFLDDGNNEYSNGRVATTLLFDGALSDDQVSYRFANPFTTNVPAPSALATMLIGLAPAAVIIRRRKSINA